MSLVLGSSASFLTMTLRKLSDAEIETAYDQAADMAVLQGTQVRAG